MTTKPKAQRRIETLWEKMDKLGKLPEPMVLDVSKITDIGGGVTIIKRPTSAKSKRFGAAKFPIVSSNLEHYIIAMDLLGGRDTYAAEIAEVEAAIAAASDRKAVPNGKNSPIRNGIAPISPYNQVGVKVTPFPDLGIKPVALKPAGMSPAIMNPVGTNQVVMKPIVMKPAGVNPAAVNPTGVILVNKPSPKLNQQPQLPQLFQPKQQFQLQPQFQIKPQVRQTGKLSMPAMKFNTIKISSDQLIPFSSLESSAAVFKAVSNFEDDDDEEDNEDEENEEEEE